MQFFDLPDNCGWAAYRWGTQHVFSTATELQVGDLVRWPYTREGDICELVPIKRIERFA